MKRIKKQSVKSTSLQHDDLVAVVGGGSLPEPDDGMSGVTGAHFPRPRNPGVIPDPTIIPGPTDIPIPQF